MVIIYGFLSFVDYIIYSMAASMFRIIMDIANIQFFTDAQITSITHRVYVVVGVLMLFKIVIGAIQYMINPDVLDDKDKGFSGILLRTAISLGIIVIIPPLFSLAFQIQKPVVEAIPNIIFGTEDRVEFTDDKVGMNISFQVLEAFVPVREGHENKIAADEKIYDIPSFQRNVMAGCPPISVFGLFGSYDTCHYNYIIVISTIAGGFLCYVLFVMIMDIAIRTIKFSIIQILAPIPVSGYVFDKEKLGKFTKAAVSVYLDLFIRMAVIYFIVFAIEKITSSGILKEVADGDLFRSIIVNVAIILGLLMFAKNAPKFITELLGIENVTSDDMKNMFTRAAGLFGATIGSGKSFISSRANARNEALKEAKLTPDKLKKMEWRDRHKAIKDAMKNYNKKQGFGHGITARSLRSAGASYRTGFYQSYIKGQGYKETFDAADRAGQRSYDISKALDEKGVTRAQYAREIMNRKLGIESSFDRESAQAEAARSISDASKTSLDLAHNQLIDKNGGAQLTNDYITKISALTKTEIDAAGNVIQKQAWLDDLTKATNFTISKEDGSSLFTINMDQLNVDKGGTWTLADVQKKLQDIVNDVNLHDSKAKRQAQTQLDLLNGEIDKFILGQEVMVKSGMATNSGVKHNPALGNTIQVAKDLIAKHAATPFGLEMQKLLKEYGAVDDEGKIIPGLEGVVINLYKSKGMDAETAAKASMGKQELAGMSAKEIADKYAKK